MEVTVPLFRAARSYLPEIEFLPVCLSYLPMNLDVWDSRTTLDIKWDGSSNPSVDAKSFFPINLCAVILRVVFQLSRTSSNGCLVLQRVLEFTLAVPNITLQAVSMSIKPASQFPAAENDKAAKCQLGTQSSLANWSAAEQIGQALSMTKQHWTQQIATHKEIAWKCKVGARMHKEVGPKEHCSVPELYPSTTPTLKAAKWFWRLTDDVGIQTTLKT